MNAPESPTVIRQHLIDPEICIRCNSCEEACPINAITHDSRNYVVNADICASCRACIPVCPTGAIDNWHPVLKASAYSLEAQFSWDELPPLQDLVISAVQEANSGQPIGSEGGSDSQNVDEDAQTNAATSASSTIPPWSAEQPQLNLYTLKAPVLATVAGNYRLTATDVPSDIHHIVLDFSNQLFPILEGQSIGIIPPGTDANGKPHYIRMYSVASPRNGERDGFNNLSLTVKRVAEDHDGNPVNGVASNYLCDLVKGAVVQVTGPFGANALMPNHPDSNILMVCTGTGSAPMRAMTEYRRRLRVAGRPLNGKLMLFFGARNPEELPYFGPLLKLSDDFIIKHFAFSRVPEQPKIYVQDKIREAGEAVVDVLKGDTYLYICGLKGMETGVMTAIAEVCSERGVDWPALQTKMVDSGRFHVETY